MEITISYIKPDRKRVRVQFLSVDRSGYFQFYRISFKKTGEFILPKPVALNSQ